MNKKVVKTILMKYFYRDSTGYHPYYVSDCSKWDEMFEELFGIEE